MIKKQESLSVVASKREVYVYGKSETLGAWSRRLKVKFKRCVSYFEHDEFGYVVRVFEALA